MLLHEDLTRHGSLCPSIINRSETPRNDHSGSDPGSFSDTWLVKEE